MRRAAFGSLIWLALSVSNLSAAQPADVQRVAAGLQSSIAAEKHAAADALADLGPGAQPAVPQLVAALASPDVELRWRAARALGVIGDAQAMPALRKQTADPQALVRAQAIFAMEIGRAH